ncbi:SidA/IucD/PvdA family monooxygenase, partial [Facilibium subflavum]|uniref:SidA/IucD/PvdA family monooxygenase n=1 Tax=Facilibium subflavum TaxID=2219058 RepID=UPI0013C2D30C
LDIKTQALKDPHITIIGSGQSAGEIFLDLMRSKSDSTKITCLTRSKVFFPMEYSKLGLEHFSPDYIDYFYNLSSREKPKLIKEQDLLYKGISAQTISDIYDVLYDQTIQNKDSAELIANAEFIAMSDNSPELNCYFYHKQQDKDFLVKTDRVIAATGYKTNINPAITNIDKLIVRGENSCLKVTKDYKLITKNTNLNIFIQNAEMHTHGVGAPD